MQSTNSYQRNYDFPVYQKADDIQEDKDIIQMNLLTQIDVSGTWDLSLDEYKNLKNKRKIVDGGEKQYTWNALLIMDSFNERIIADELMEINENPFNKKRCSFVNESIHSYIPGCKYYPGNVDKIFKKCKLLIELGEGVNDLWKFLPNTMPLQYILEEEIEDSFIQLFVSYGAVVHKPISNEQQARVNAVMRPIIVKTNAIFTFFKCMGLLNDLPQDVTRYICLIGMNEFSMAPEVLHKIMGGSAIMGEREPIKEIREEIKKETREQTSFILKIFHYFGIIWKYIVTEPISYLRAILFKR